MNYQETLNYLFEKLPMFQRKGGIAFKKDLSNTLAFCNAIGDPHKNVPVIHVAGTNGKGSVSHLLASVLQEQGFKTGLYTSPHLLDFRERIKIDGKEISPESVVKFTEDYYWDIESIEPSFFEVTAIMAFWHFANEDVDVAVIETGLGGRLDSTNVVDPLLSVITNISLEHQEFLGDTIEEIAYEKAGIIKENRPVVIGQNHPNSRGVFNNIAQQRNAPIFFSDNEYRVEKSPDNENGALLLNALKNGAKHIENLRSDLKGDYQIENTRTVLTSVKVLRDFYDFFTPNDQHIRAGIENVKSNTGLMGRWQIMGYRPFRVFDIAHNYEGLSKVLKQVKEVPHDRLHIVYGTVREKSPEELVGSFPSDCQLYLCSPKIERAMPVEELEKQLAGIACDFNAVGDPSEAYQRALQNAGEKDLILVTGSAFVVADVLHSVKTTAHPTQ